MNKKDFVQRVLIRSLPKEDKISAGIAYAERLWSELDARGYGNGEKSRPKDYIDHYALIKHKDDFDRFWTEFRLKKGRNGAAEQWNRIDPDEDLRQKIIRAARKEAETAQEGITRKWAQGWLSERRFDDMDVSTMALNKVTDDGGLQHAKDMLKRCKGNPEMTDFWKKEISKITGQIASLSGDMVKRIGK